MVNDCKNNRIGKRKTKKFKAVVGRIPTTALNGAEFTGDKEPVSQRQIVRDDADRRIHDSRIASRPGGR